MFQALTLLVDYLAPLFLIVSPVTSYADQIFSIHRSKNSDGFSLDIPLIMLVASILKVFYWFGAYFSVSLLFQACLMIVVQLFLLKVALDNRPSPGVKGGLGHTPFSSNPQEGSLQALLAGKRPYEFWQWAHAKTYYLFLAYFAATLLVIHVVFRPISSSQLYIGFLGYFGLAVEALLPIPQMIQNHNARSCKGFRLSVIINWLAGDVMKMSFFFLSSDYIPWPFKLCGVFQAICDCYLGLQFYMYGTGSGSNSGSGGMNLEWLKSAGTQ